MSSFPVQCKDIIFLFQEILDFFSDFMTLLVSILSYTSPEEKSNEKKIYPCIGRFMTNRPPSPRSPRCRSGGFPSGGSLCVCVCVRKEHCPRVVIGACSADDDQSWKQKYKSSFPLMLGFGLQALVAIGEMNYRLGVITQLNNFFKKIN